VHHPEAFNFADTERFRIEKEKAARGEKDEHNNPIVPVTPYAYLLVNAAILFAIYYKFGKKPITDGLQERHDTIAKELAEASRIKEEAEARAAEYKDKLDRLGDELQVIKADIIKAGEADRARIVKEAEEKAERMKRDAQFLLDQELKQLRNDMIAFTAEAAVAAAESVLKAKVTSSDHDRLNDEFLKDVTTAKSQTGGAS
jgi:F-type H+-transporting ATPase subunit b